MKEPASLQQMRRVFISLPRAPLQLKAAVPRRLWMHTQYHEEQHQGEDVQD